MQAPLSASYQLKYENGQETFSGALMSRNHTLTCMSAMMEDVAVSDPSSNFK